MIKNQINLAWKIARFLPLYIDLQTFKRLPYSKSKGYSLAIWNCGDGRTLWSHLRDSRITIRKDGHPYFVIKHGYV